MITDSGVLARDSTVPDWSERWMLRLRRRNLLLLFQSRLKILLRASHQCGMRPQFTLRLLIMSFRQLSSSRLCSSRPCRIFRRWDTGHCLPIFSEASVGIFDLVTRTCSESIHLHHAIARARYITKPCIRSLTRFLG